MSTTSRKPPEDDLIDSQALRREWVKASECHTRWVFLRRLFYEDRRLLGLFAVACCRHLLGSAITRRRVTEVLEVLEQHLDGEASKKTLEAARKWFRVFPANTEVDPVRHAAELKPRLFLLFSSFCSFTFNQGGMPTQQADFLIVIVGPGLTFNTAWKTYATVGLARSMYESRDFAAMPVLADALEEAGCNDARVLDYCRGRGPFIRGCWILDMLLDKRGSRANDHQPR